MCLLEGGGKKKCSVYTLFARFGGCARRGASMCRTQRIRLSTSIKRRFERKKLESVPQSNAYPVNFFSTSFPFKDIRGDKVEHARTPFGRSSYPLINTDRIYIEPLALLLLLSHLSLFGRVMARQERERKGLNPPWRHSLREYIQRRKDFSCIHLYFLKLCP